MAKITIKTGYKINGEQFYLAQNEQGEFFCKGFGQNQSKFDTEFNENCMFTLTTDLVPYLNLYFGKTAKAIKEPEIVTILQF